MQPAMQMLVSNHPTQLYSRRNNKLPRAVEKPTDDIWEPPIPAFKELPLLAELSVELEASVELDVLLSFFAPESTWLNWLMTKDEASAK